MIVDSIQNADKYFAMHPKFAKAFEYIRSLDFNNLPIGKFEVDGREIHGFVSEKEGATRETTKFESHKNYIDIQVCPAGAEEYGWKPLHDCVPSIDGYLTEKDAFYYKETAAINFTIKKGEFAIFYPEDVHSAGVGEGIVKKLVLKVKI
ncbi:YhcH/YjgK/YiaL family protein [Ferruginibacter lapsinanis]|uniref:YhcH/YjgK/YiaL family protein n=1 Tax=Ferruginibacter lapsinanis TaxID=563172 RepID=UPI0021D3FB57|nr:YhcH/YjgK/YiaL family protein [Ferruginibacter lapsinanis]UEG49377.1 YhcH/YjgK/YiaL family protein [Ferruginibacter lapsinanis]